MIRERLSLGAEEHLTCDIVSGMTELDANSLEITSVVGVQNLTSLDSLYLDNNPNLTDIQPLLDSTGLGAGDT